MSDQKRRPVRSLLTYCWYCLAVLIILTAIIIQSARWLSPSINQFKDSIEAFASEQLNSNVRIGQISAKWVGLNPQVSIQDLSIQHHAAFIDNQSSNRNRNFLNARFIRLEINILKSLLYRVPVWGDVEASGLSAQVVQNKRGAWSLGDFASKGTKKASNWRYRSPSSLFLTAQNVNLNDANITLLFSNKRELTTNVPLITLKNNGHFHRLEAKASVSKESSFQLIIEGVGDPSIADQFFAKAYLKMENFAEETLVQAFSQLTDVDLEQEWIQSSNADVELWFDFASTSRFLMSGHIALKNVESVIDELKTETGNEWRADIVGGYRPSVGLSLGVRNAVIDEAFSVPPFIVNVGNKKQLDIGIESINLERLKQWVVDRLFRLSFFNSEKFPLAKVKEILLSLDPKGSIRDLSIQVDLQDLEKTTVSAVVDHVSTHSRKNVPAFSNVSGYVNADINNGFIIIDAKQLSLYPKTVYKAPIVADVATGLVAWELNFSKKEVDIFGHDLSLQGNYGDAKGNFLLNLNWRKEPNKNNLALQLGLENSKAIFHQQLIPRTLPKALLAWMDSAIELGDLRHTGVFYHGGFTKGANRSVQAFVNLDQGQLQFDSNWPKAKAVNADLLIDNKRLFALVNNVSAYEDEAFSGEIHWNAGLNNKLLIDLGGVASTSSALKYIDNSILSERLGVGTNQVSASGGDIDVAVTVGLSFNNSSLDTELSTQDISLRFINNTLRLDEPNISFDSIRGALHYSNKKGFVSKDLEASFLQQPITINVYEDRQIPNILHVVAKGKATINAISHWLSQPKLNYLDGALNYTARVQFPLNDNSKAKPLLSIRSNLIGVKSDLPQPFKKASKEKVSLDFNLPLLDDNPIFELTIGSFFTTKFSLGNNAKDDESLVGFFSFNDTSASQYVELPKSGIKLLGEFNELQLDEWLPVFESLSDNEYFSSPSSKGVSDTSLFLSVNNLRFNDQVLKNIIFSGEKETNGWRVIADNKDVLGSLLFSGESSRPLVMEFDYLNWPPNYNSATNKTNINEKSDDPLSSFNPSSLTKVSVNVNRLTVFGNPLGRWSFDVLPDEQGVDFRNIYADVSGFNLKGISDSDGGFLRWNAKTSQNPLSTSIYGRVVGKNPKVLFEQWGLPVTLESDKTEIDFNLSWPGSPLAVELESLNGSMMHHYEDGVFSQESIDDSSGVLRVFGLLNFNSWARRVRLDFSDVYKKGVIFDSLDGELSFNHGVMTLTEPLVMKGPSSEMKLSGVVDYPRQTVDANLEASLPIGGNLTLITALTAGLPVAAGVYIASKIFKKQLNQVSSINYTISGNLNDPDVNVEKTEAKKEETLPDSDYRNDGS